MKQKNLYLLGGIAVLGYAVYKYAPNFVKKTEESAVSGFIGGAAQGFGNATTGFIDRVVNVPYEVVKTVTQFIPPVPSVETSPYLANLAYEERMKKYANTPAPTFATGTPAQEAIRQDYYAGTITLQQAVQAVSATKQNVGMPTGTSSYGGGVVAPGYTVQNNVVVPVSAPTTAPKVESFKTMGDAYFQTQTFKNIAAAGNKAVLGR